MDEGVSKTPLRYKMKKVTVNGPTVWRLMYVGSDLIPDPRDSDYVAEIDETSKKNWKNNFLFWSYPIVKYGKKLWVDVMCAYLSTRYEWSFVSCITYTFTEMIVITVTVLIQ